MGATDHEIYKKRGKLNAQIGILLGIFVILVMLGTIPKIRQTYDDASDEMSTSAEAEVNS